MKTSLLVFLIIFGLLLGPTVCFAGSPWTEKTTYWDKTVGKLDFGMKNLLGGWTELFTEPMHHHKDAGDVFVGLGTGLYKSVVYTVGGALHVVTFPIPLDVPLPDNGVNLD